MNRRILIFYRTLPLLALAALQAHSSSREQLLLDFGWKFSLGDASSPHGDFGYGLEASFAKAGEAPAAASPEFEDSTWRTVDLPHDWAVELDFVHVNDKGVH